MAHEPADHPAEREPSRFRDLPAPPDPQRLRTEHESWPDPEPDAAAQRAFIERAQG